MSPLAPFGTQRGELSSCEIALFLYRKQEREAGRARLRAERQARRRDRIERIKRRLRLA